MSSTLIKSQVDKFVSEANVVKKSNFSDHITKSVSYFNVVKGLNQTLETPPDQTSIDTCVRGTNQKLKDQLVMKFQLAHFIAIHGKPFKLYSDFANFEKEFHNVDLGNSYLSDTSCHKMLKLGSAIFIKFLFFSPNDSPSKTMKNAFYFI